MIAAFLVGIASGALNAISTGGGLISVPGLLLMGVSPLAAIATTRLSVLSGGIAALAEYRKSRAVQWRYVPAFLCLAIASGFIGSWLLPFIDHENVGKVMGILLLLMIPLHLASRRLGLVRTQTSKQRKIWGCIALFFALLYLAMFGAGGGVLVVYTLTYFYGLTLIESNATGTVVGLATAAIACTMYALQGLVIFSIGIPLLIGAAIGGYCGAFLAIKEGAKWVKWVLTIIMVSSSIVLLGS